MAGLNLDPKDNSFTYTFPPPYFGKKFGIVRQPASTESSIGWSDISLYIHIPFCEQECSYCSLHRQIPQNNQLIEKYLKALEKEIVYLNKYFGSIKVESLYLGGGTPSILPPSMLAHILELVESNFLLSDSVETCIECCPTINRSRNDWYHFFDKLITRHQLKLNRISFGVQSFHTETLHNMGRIGGVDSIMDLLSIADEMIPTYNIDLILGYPEVYSGLSVEESVENVIYHISKMLDKGFTLPSISLYQLWDTDSIGVMMLSESKLPDKRMLYSAKCKLQSHLFDLGYTPGVISTLVKSEQYKHRWVLHRDMSFRHLGIGSGVYSIFPNEFVQRQRDIKGYIDCMINDDDPHKLDICYSLTDEEIEFRRIIMGLRSYEWLNSRLDNRLSVTLRDLEEKVEILLGLGIIEKNLEKIRLSEDAFIIGNEVSSFLHPHSHPRKLSDNV